MAQGDDPVRSARNFINVAPTPSSVPPPPTARISGMIFTPRSAKRGGDVDDRRRPLAQRADLGLETFGPGQPDRFHLGRLGPARLGDVGRLAVGLFLAGLGGLRGDLHADLGLGQLGLHVGRALGLLHVDAQLLGLLLHLVGGLLLVGDLALREHLDQFLRQDHVLDVHAAGLHFVLAQLRRGCAPGRSAAPAGGSR